MGAATAKVSIMRRSARSAGRVAFAACLLILPALAATAADNLTNQQKTDLGNACVAAGDVCRNSCGAKYPNQHISFNDGLLFDRCNLECDAIETRCMTSIPDRSAGSGSVKGGGLLLDPGTGNPPPTTQPFLKPGTAIFSK